MRVAVVGDPTFIAGFKLVGVEDFKALTADEVRNIVKGLSKTDEYAIIILPERYVDTTAEIRSGVIKEGRITPMFSFVPDYTGIKGKRVEEIKRSVSLAVGAKLKL